MLDEVRSPEVARALPIEDGRAALRLSGITKRFGSLVANDHIDLEVEAGEILALLGENGAGKTTLMNILFGHYVADEGSIEVAGTRLRPGSPHAAISAGVGMVHQHFTLADNLTILENIILGTEPFWWFISKKRASERRLLDLAKQFGFQINPGSRVGTLSVGERQHVEILKALYRDAKVLILDEPTAVLVPHEVEALFQTLRKLASNGVSVIFISHKLREVIAIADRVVVLRRGKVVDARPIAGARPSELAELMVGRPVEKCKPGVDTALRTPSEPALVLSNVNVSSHDGRPLLSDICLTVRQHEIVGVAGVAGNGQVALTELLCGLAKPSSGVMELLGKKVTKPSPIVFIDGNVARIPEDRHTTGLYGDLTIWENVIAERYRTPDFARSGFQRIAHAKSFSEKIIGDFDVRCTGPDAITRLLSGGNMQKLILGRTLSRGPRMVVANQPTRGLDVGAATYVHKRLNEARDGGAGVLLISDDLDELLELSDRIVVMYRGHLVESGARGAINMHTLGLQMAGHSA